MKEALKLTLIKDKLSKIPLTPRRKKEASKRMGLNGSAIPSEWDLIVARFRSKFSTAKDGCWEWNGSLTSVGYAIVPCRIKGKNVHILGSRLSFFLENGKELDNFACHRCDNPKCVRPDHIFDGTHTENCLDCIRKGRRRAPVFDRPKGEGHSSAKLTNADVSEIASLISKGESSSVIADRFGVSDSTISFIKTGVTWKHHPAVIALKASALALEDGK